MKKQGKLLPEVPCALQCKVRIFFTEVLAPVDQRQQPAEMVETQVFGFLLKPIRFCVLHAALDRH